MAAKALVSWSGGKDSAMALQRALADPSLDVIGLLTTMNEAHDRVSIHGVRADLARAQADAIGLPIEFVPLPDACTNDAYEARMGDAMRRWKQRGVSGVVHGDLFLQDVRAYREAKLAMAGLTGVFPLWGADTRHLANRCIESGFKATLCSVDTDQLDASFCGRDFDATLLRDLPPSVDPCGERGEFHTFVRDGPIFSKRVRLEKGATVIRGRFAYTDLVPAPVPRLAPPTERLNRRP